MLPESLREYLSNPNNRAFQLDPNLEVIEGAFYAPEAITLKTFNVDGTPLHSKGLLDHNPQEHRSYPGYDLVKEVNEYAPEGLLVWFPDLNQFGTCDGDHGEIITFPGTSWEQIMDDPTWYLNARWFSNLPWLNEKINFAYLNPWPA